MISLEFDYNSAKSLYVQLYEYLKEEITEGRIETGERLPSLRNLADTLGVSVTTVKTAYEQLIVEGYLISKPQSGYYAARGAVIKDSRKRSKDHEGEDPERAGAQSGDRDMQKVLAMLSHKFGSTKTVSIVVKVFLHATGIVW